MSITVWTIVVLSACGLIAFLFKRSVAPSNLGSVSRDWVIEHRGDRIR